jgi:sugar phosphate permease
MFWGFTLGGIVWGRLAEHVGFRRVILFGALGTTLFNIVASFGGSVHGLFVPWAAAGFVNAATWAPGLALLAQWWPRLERGRAIGSANAAAGTALLVVWMAAPWAASIWGWRAALRYPPLALALAGILFYLAVRDRPSQAGLPEYAEPEGVSRAAEDASAGSERGLRPYLHLLKNWRLQIACHVRGLDTLSRYGLVSWVPVYYAQAGGFDLKQMALVTFAYPVGLMLGPLTGGYVSDRLFKGNRSAVIMMAALLSASAIAGVALSPADSAALAALFLIVGGFAISMAPVHALAVDLAGRRLAGTATGLLTFHGYFYAAMQAWIFGWLSLASPDGWTWVFLIMAATRLLSAAAISRVRA